MAVFQANLCKPVTLFLPICSRYSHNMSYKVFISSLTSSVTGKFSGLILLYPSLYGITIQ